MDHNSLFPLSRKKYIPKKKIPVDGYDADLGSNEKILPQSRNNPEH